MNNEDIERFDNDLFRASDGKWIKFSDHEYTVQQLQSKLTALEVVATRQREFIKECAVAEDRSNLDGDNAETVLQQINDGAEELLALTPQSVADRLAEKDHRRSRNQAKG